VQAVEQITAEFFFFDGTNQIAMVAAIRRTSTRIVFVPPRRSNS